MQRGDQRRKLALLHILQFINEQNRRGCRMFRGSTDLLQQSGKIDLQTSIVRKPGLGLKVQPDFDVGIFDLQRFGETRQGSKPTLGHVLCRVNCAQTEQ